jgi:penicillin-binding protein 2
MNKKKKGFNRYTGLLLVMILIFSLLINQMVNLQVIHGEEYALRANTEFIVNIDNPAPRGEILDTNGLVLATSVQSYDLIYVDTTESRKVIYSTIDKVKQLLSESGQEITFEFSLQTDPFRFEFGSDDPEFIRKSELRWKKDRGINDFLFREILQEETGKNKISELNEAETDRLDELILAFTPEETYMYLMDFYDLYDALMPTKEEKAGYAKLTGEEIYQELLKKFTPEQIHSYLVIRDSIKMESYSGSKAVTLVTNMSEKAAFTFLQQLSFLPGIDVKTNPIRLYPYQTLASHVIGYLNPIPAGSQTYYEERGYDLSTDFIGVSGIEAAYEDMLKGRKGSQTVRVDKNGRVVSELFELDSYPGNTVKLTLDAGIQNAAEQALKDIIIDLSTVNTKHRVAGYNQDSSNATRGAVVVQNVNTGEILGMASYPNYDPNIFAIPGRLSTEMYNAYFNPDYRAYAEELIRKTGISATPEDLFRFNADGTVTDFNDIYAKPFFNYATQGLTPPGSTFKPVTAVAALEMGVVTKDTVIRDTGAYSNPNTGTPVTNEGQAVYGNTNLAKAIAKSSNVYFADMGYRIYSAGGLNSLAEWSWKLGMGYDPLESAHSTTGIEIGENIYGNVYNHGTKVALTQRLFLFDLVDFLQKGKSRSGSSFHPLNIGKDNADEEAVAMAKEAIKEEVRKGFALSLEDANVMIRKDFYTVKSNLTKLFQDYLNLLSAEEKAAAAPASFYADQVSAKIVYDQTSELISPRNVINSALGQGDNQVTLLQMANALATIANGGTRYKTTLIDEILDQEGQVLFKNAPQVVEETGIKSGTVNAILEGLHDITKPGGTAYSIFKDFPISNGGKTGTATFREDQETVGRAAFGIYTAVAPIENPEISVAVIVYDATRGSFVAPVALAVFEEYFKDRLALEYPAYQRKYNYALPQSISGYGSDPETPVESSPNTIIGEVSTPQN